MAVSSKEVKKLIKNMKQGVSCFQASLSFIAALTTCFLLIFTVRYPHAKIFVLQPTPLPPITNFSSSSSCTYASTTDFISANLSSSSLAPANVSVHGDVEKLGWLKRNKRRRKSGTEGRRRRRGSDDIDKSCDLFDGKWVEDGEKSTHPLYEPGSCPFVEEAFDCYKNGRPDLNYTRLRWKPKRCSMPRFQNLIPLSLFVTS